VPLSKLDPMVVTVTFTKLNLSRLKNGSSAWDEPGT
jgi:hypothetical protein